MSGRGGERERVRQNRWEGREGRREGEKEGASGVNGGRGREWEMIHAVSEPPSAPARPSAAPDAAAQLPAAPGCRALPRCRARVHGGGEGDRCRALRRCLPQPRTAGGCLGAAAATLRCTAETLKAAEVRTMRGGTRTGVCEGRRGGGGGDGGVRRQKGGVSIGDRREMRPIGTKEREAGIEASRQCRAGEGWQRRCGRRGRFNLCGGGGVRGGRSRPGRVPAVMRRHLGYALRRAGPQLRASTAEMARGGGGTAGTRPG